MLKILKRGLECYLSSETHIKEPQITFIHTHPYVLSCSHEHFHLEKKWLMILGGI